MESIINKLTEIESAASAIAEHAELQKSVLDKEYEENKERFHGIGLDEIRKFEKIYRYYPYYTEGCLNT